MEYTWFILGNGRKGYIERTIASWEANLIDRPKYSFIFDDSGNPSHLRWLKEKYSDRFTIIQIATKSAGHVAAIRKIFNTLKELDTDYFLGIEEDWMLFRPITISEIISELEKYPNILQMRIPRTVWYASYHRLDIDSGSLLLHHLKDHRNTIAKSNDKFFEIRSSFYFWSHNPSVFNKKILFENYPDSKSHEYEFGIKLLEKYPLATIGFWANNPYEGYITHIGFRDTRLLNSLPEHDCEWDVKA